MLAPMYTLVLLETLIFVPVTAVTSFPTIETVSEFDTSIPGFPLITMFCEITTLSLYCVSMLCEHPETVLPIMLTKELSSAAIPQWDALEYCVTFITVLYLSVALLACQVFIPTS